MSLSESPVEELFWQAYLEFKIKIELMREVYAIGDTYMDVDTRVIHLVSNRGICTPEKCVCNEFSRSWQP